MQQVQQVVDICVEHVVSNMKILPVAEKHKNWNLEANIKITILKCCPKCRLVQHLKGWLGLL